MSKRLCRWCHGSKLYLSIFASSKPQPCYECGGTGNYKSRIIEQVVRNKNDPSYCQPGSLGKRCGLYSSDNQWVCTREKGHSGYHAGHGSDDRQVVIFE